MLMNSEHFIRPDIIAMKPYTPIVPFEVLSARLGRRPSEIIKLDANENPYGPSPQVLAALASGQFFHIYPDPESNELRQALSQYVNVPAERLMAGAGADELIDVVLRAVLARGDVAVDCPPSFGMYPFSTDVNAGRYVPVWRRDDFSLDVAAVETAVHQHQAKILILCSPNNPDGSVIDDESLRRLLALPTLVLLDEAYADFAEVEGYHSHIHWTVEYDNLVVLRTFSKLAGLAGLRVGYGAFPEWLLPHLWKIKQPYNVNVAASIAALAALSDPAWMQEKVRLLVAERNRMSEALSEISYLEPYPSMANFILCRVHGERRGNHATASGRDAHQLKLDLEQEGILVRYFNKSGLDNCIRISAGRPEDTDRLLAVLREWDHG
ncbi:MAG: histidinol-phosphate transaminase [Anaerolineae bacterium]|nr:histidinol-phosphate transaminase [Anaerolineae bacterium]